jgi:hypothetical protein
VGVVVKDEMTENGRFLTVHSKAEIFKRGSVRIKAQEFQQQSM